MLMKTPKFGKRWNSVPAGRPGSSCKRHGQPLWTKIWLPLLGAVVCWTPLPSLGQARLFQQSRVPKRPPVMRPNAGARRPARALLQRSDPEAVALLQQMLHPQVEYAGEEQTWIAQGGMTSRQTIKGDRRGNVIRHYLLPEFLRGDIMLTGPNKYMYYHASTRSLTEIAPEGGQEDVRDKRIVNGIRQRIFVARRTGNETVAGRNATIVLVTPANGQQGYAKFWIDPTTGIKLKIEIANAANSRVSTSELSNLVIGAAANVLPRDFKPGQFGAAAAKEIKRQRVGSVQEAAEQLNFHPLEPSTLPPGFRLEGVQLLTGPARVGLFLRYTDGVTVFTLTEHRIRANQRPGGAAVNGAASHWYIAVGEYDVDVVYRGHLPPQHEQMVHDSLH